MIQIPLNIKMEENVIFFFCGYEQTVSGHSVGPLARDYYLLHMVHNGKGIIETQGNRHIIREGEGFIIYPNIITHYCSDTKEPWEYSWIAIKGDEINTILDRTTLSPEYNKFTHHNFDFFKFFSIEYQSAISFDTSAVLTIKSYFYSFFSQLVSLNGKDTEYREKAISDEYIEAVENIINTNFHNNITVKWISDYVGLNMSYLGNLFKKQKGISIKSYLTNVRLKRACELLKNTDYLISDIARSVGYYDQLQFTRIFKKHKLVSPSQYRSRSIRK